MIDTSKSAVQDASSRPAQRSLKHALHRYRFLLLALLVVCILPLTLRSGSLATEVLVFALAALGCNLLLGHTGLLSFGQGIFLRLGGFCAGLVLTKTAMPIPVALLAAIVIGAAAAALVGWFSIRQRGTYFVMLTLAFGQLFYFLAYTTPDLTGGDNGLLDIPRPGVGLVRQSTRAVDFAVAVLRFCRRVVSRGVLAADACLALGIRPDVTGDSRQRGARGRSRL